ncbi:MAG: glycerate kinase [Eisenbergiella sp.]
MKMIFASDSFKGSISGREAGELLKKAANEVFGETETIILTAADGGEGTVDALLETCGEERILAGVHDARMRPVQAYYGRIDEKQAVIEMAAASGLPMLENDLRDPLKTTSYGTGELLRDALDKGFAKIAIGLGGSATNDGGMGAMRALGACFWMRQTESWKDAERIWKGKTD